MKIEGILFDKDGTLFDFNLTWGHWARGFIDDFTTIERERRAIADAFLFDYDETVFLPNSPIIAGTSQEIFRAVKRVYPQQDASEISDRIIASAKRAQMVPVCDLHAFLGGLRRAGVKLGVATNDSEAGAYAGLDGQDLIQYFDFIAGADSGYGAKPDKGMCVAFCETQGVETGRALMVGDSVFDIRAGQSAGMVTVGVLTGVASQDDLAEADVVLDDISQIPDWFDAQKR